MEKAIGEFIQSLRHHGLPISTAETLDALNATAKVGVADRQRLKTVLGLTLAKTLAHRGQLETLFDDFFAVQPPPPPAGEQSNTGEAGEQQPPPEQGSGEPQEGADSPIQSELGQKLLQNQQQSLQMEMMQAAEAQGAQTMKIFLQKNRVSWRILEQLGDRELQHELLELAAKEQHLDLVAQLQQKRQQLAEMVKDHVEQQYLLYSGKNGEKLREETLHKINLSHIDHTQQQNMVRLVKKVAKKLASLHSRRRKLTKRGLLDVRKTVAANAAFDGFLFHTRWKSTRVDRPRVMVICDVSGSVAKIARFLLLFVYSLQEVLPKTRSFVFASNLGEVTDYFNDYELEEALGVIMKNWANMPTDYGKALDDFKELALKDVDHKTTVIMLGDARNNGVEPRTDIWQTVYNRAQRVLWLNPEPRVNWNSGDSIMSEYGAYCSIAEPCNSLRDLERIMGRMLKYSR